MTGGWAVMAGAKYLEVHCKLPATSADNPDAGAHALLPNHLAEYIRNADYAARVMGDTTCCDERHWIEAERAMRPYVVRL